MNISLILPTLSDPRFHKRNKSLIKDNHNVKIYAFDRGEFKKNSLNVDNVQILGKMSNKNYLKRFGVYFKILKTIIRNKKTTDLYYFFTLDFACIGMLVLGRNRYIYEIGDFSYLGLPRIVVKILTYIEMIIIKKSYRTVLTSDGFKFYLNKKNKSKSNLNNLIVIPNKLPKEIVSYQRKVSLFKTVNNLKFGFVGILRYPKTVLSFVKTIGKKFPNHQFVFYGGGVLTNDFLKLAEKYPNLYYKGEFKNPDDLEMIYNSFDIQLACYDINSLNVKLAEPNKLYDSIYFGNPILVTKGTFLGSKVESLGIGFTLQDFTEKGIEEFILNLDVNKLNKARENMLNIETKELIDSDIELLEALKAIEMK